MGGLPMPPNKESIRPHSASGTNPCSEPTKSARRASKRTSNTHSHPHLPSTHDANTHSMAHRQNTRVWKACERCRMKKTKCDGEFPCKRCKDDGLVCTITTRKKTEHKQLPKGYAEVLESNQVTLIAAVHKLYSMVRNGQPWDLGEPELNDRGQPVIHNIASKLGCIRPNSDIDLPVHSVLPEDNAGMAELARQLDEQQRETESTRTDRASSSEFCPSDYEHGRKSVFRGQERAMSLQSPSYQDFNVTAESEILPRGAIPTSYPSWVNPASTDSSQASIWQPLENINMDMSNQGLRESNFDTIKPPTLSCSEPEVMMGMGDYRISSRE